MWSLGAMVATVGLLAACAHVPLLSSGDRKEACRFAIDDKVGTVAFHPNIYSNPAGGLVGAGAGALAGLQGGYLAIFTVPIGAAIGAVGGTACGVASVDHPRANEEFDRLLHEADFGVLKTALLAALNSPRAECIRTPEREAAATGPDAVIEIEKVDAGMGCVFGQQEYWVAVQWRTVAGKTRRTLNWSTTRCTQTSFRDVDDWFADPVRGRVEIERVLAKTGQRMAAELLAQEHVAVQCQLQSDERGEVSAR